MLPLGATITLSFKATGSPALQVPLAALHDGGQGTGVWVIDSRSEVTFRPVAVVALGQETATIAPGALTTRDLVVAIGAHLLRAGEKVRFLKDPT
jgi:hypothetical protein